MQIHSCPIVLLGINLTARRPHIRVVICHLKSCCRSCVDRHGAEMYRLTTETVQGAALSLECVDNIERRDGLALGVLGVGDGVTNDTLEEGLQDTASLLVDH
jgi:hypothetical protein